MIARLAGLTGLAFTTQLSAVAQSQPAAPAGGGLFEMVFLIGGMFAIMYFLIIRPQNKRQQAHRAMIDAVKKGDKVVTNGGLVGKVTKVAEGELTIELSEGVRVQVVRGMVADVRTKGAPAAANDTKPS